MTLLRIPPNVKVQQNELKQSIIALLERDETFVYTADYGELDSQSNSRMLRLDLTYREYDKIEFLE